MISNCIAEKLGHTPYIEFSDHCMQVKLYTIYNIHICTITFFRAIFIGFFQDGYHNRTCIIYCIVGFYSINIEKHQRGVDNFKGKP